MPAQATRRIVGNAAARRKRMIAFGWYGGKFSHLDFILPNLPEDARHFCDVFGGSAAVVINRRPTEVETYNDIDSELVNFFKTLRDDKTSESLIRAIGLTPFSREELALACQPSVGLDPIEKARRFFVRARQTRTGLAQTASEGRWAHCLLTSRAGMSGAVSRWLGSVEGLAEIVQRLQRIQIENAPAMEVLERYDSPDTLFYLDPPYVHQARGDSHAYAVEMTDSQHEALGERLLSIEGRFALSGYRNPIYDRVLAGIRRVEAPAKLCHSVRQERQECLWVNYDENGTRLNVSRLRLCASRSPLDQGSGTRVKYSYKAG